MIKAVVFDMGGVVIPLDLQRCIDNFKQMAGCMDIEEFLNPYHQKGFFGDLEEGKIDEDQFYSECMKHCAPNTSKETIAYCFYSLIDGINPDATRLFKELKDNYKLYVLSNNNPISMEAFDNYLKSVGMSLADTFKKTFFSYQMKVLKPAPEIYRRTIEGIGARPDEILFIDDSAKNIAGAEAQGIRTLRYYPAQNNLYEAVTEYLSNNE
mgnify:CR=1 FL=1